MRVPVGTAFTAFRTLAAAVTVVAVAGCTDGSFEGHGEAGDGVRDGPTGARAVDAPGSRRIVFLGTSLTAGFGLLRANEPFPARIQGRIDVLVLELGANDGLRGIPPAELARNLEAVVRQIRERNPDVAILVLEMEAPPSRDPSYRQAFRAVFPDIAGRHGATLVPFVLEDVVGRADRIQADGIHPNVGGHRMIADRVWDHLLPVLHESGEG